jgi:hypothetical protein
MTLYIPVDFEHELVALEAGAPPVDAGVHYVPAGHQVVPPPHAPSRS